MTFIYPYIGNVIIPIDFHICQRGLVNHQPDFDFSTFSLKLAAVFANFETAVFTEVIAIGLLLAATAHWWPFVFFLLPTVSVHAMGTANHVVKQFHREASTPRLSFALFTALIGAFGGQ